MCLFLRFAEDNLIDYRTQKNDEATTTHTEQAAFPALALVNLAAQASSVQNVYHNFVLVAVNDHCVRMAVMQGEYRWHQHQHSDECFLVLEGELEIDLKSGKTVRIRPGEVFTIPAGTLHRTRSHIKTVNLCFEQMSAYTDVIFEDDDAE